MVYLPEGIWYDFNTGKRYEGKQYYLVDAPLDTCPMFAKAGSMIPAYEVMQYVGEKPYDTLNMLVFPGEGTYVHYQDNGSDFAYQGGAYNQYAFTQQENGEVTMKMMKIRSIAWTIERNSFYVCSSLTLRKCLFI